MFRRKQSQRPTRPAVQIDSMRALREAYFRVIRAFLVTAPAASPGAPPAGPSPSPPPPLGSVAFGTPAPPPPLAMGAGNPLGGPPGGFVFGMAPLMGGGDLPLRGPGGWNPGMQIPGVGSVTHEQLQQVEARVEPLLIELFGPAGIQNLPHADFGAALVELDGVHARGAIDDEQYGALKDAIGQFQQFMGG